MFIFLSMDALFVFVTPIAASKINVKVDWSSRHFPQNFNIRIKLGYTCNNVRHVPREMFKTDLVVILGNLMSQSYMDEVLRPVVLHFLCQNQCKYRAWDDNARTNQQNVFHQNNVMRINWPVQQTCLQLNM